MTTAVASREAAKQWATLWGKEQTPKQGMILQNQMSPRERKKKESKNKCYKEKKKKSFIKKYQSWPAALSIRQYHEGNVLLLLHFSERVFFNIIHLWHKHFQGLAWNSHMHRAEPASPSQNQGTYSK